MRMKGLITRSIIPDASKELEIRHTARIMRNQRRRKAPYFFFSDI